MKHFRKTLAAAALAAAISLTACSSTIPLKAEGGLYHDESNGVAYAMAPMCYEPQTIGDAYASFKSGSTEVVLYEVAGLDPTDYLTEAYSGASSMFVASDITLPDLAGFAPNVIHLCVQSNSVWEFATVTDQAEIDEIVRVYTEGESVPYPAKPPNADLRFKFASPDYPGLYYNLVYVDYGDARYLYDRETRRCVEVGDLLREYIDGKIITETEAETTEQSA
ncbi:MAG: hypothetical protein IJC15_01425 [Clostridia bacterium]|nr:hypothetical protein [Clostridia bacterium]